MISDSMILFSASYLLSFSPIIFLFSLVEYRALYRTRKGRTKYLFFFPSSFSSFGDDGPPFFPLVRAVSQPTFLSSSSTDCFPSSYVCMYTVGRVECKKVQKRTIGHSLLFFSRSFLLFYTFWSPFFLFFDWVHWFHFCWHGKWYTRSQEPLDGGALQLMDELRGDL